MIVSRCGCDDQSPSQQSVAQAWTRADRTAKQAAEAEQQLRHERRLRDIARLRSKAEIAHFETRLHTLRGLSITLTLALLASIVWLAVEIRRRRILSAVVQDIVTTEGDTPRTPTNAPESDSGSSPP
jgi:ferric-dicitrate binding protein FerR (iron transport regulator)